jgi:hypothetical protein
MHLEAMRKNYMFLLRDWAERQFLRLPQFPFKLLSGTKEVRNVTLVIVILPFEISTARQQMPLLL